MYLIYYSQNRVMNFVNLVLSCCHAPYPESNIQRRFLLKPDVIRARDKREARDDVRFEKKSPQDVRSEPSSNPQDGWSSPISHDFPIKKHWFFLTFINKYLLIFWFSNHLCLHVHILLELSFSPANWITESSSGHFRRPLDRGGVSPGVRGCSKLDFNNCDSM